MGCYCCPLMAYLMLVHACTYWQWQILFLDQGSSSPLGVVVVGPVGVPQWLYQDCWWPYRIPVKVVGCWMISVECLMPVACSSLVELGLAFIPYTGPLPTHR